LLSYDTFQVLRVQPQGVEDLGLDARRLTTLFKVLRICQGLSTSFSPLSCPWSFLIPSHLFLYACQPLELPSCSSKRSPPRSQLPHICLDACTRRQGSSGWWSPWGSPPWPPCASPHTPLCGGAGCSWRSPCSPPCPRRSARLAYSCRRLIQILSSELV